METCANCGRIIGNLETPHLFREQVVCPECGERLSRQVNPSPMQRPAQTIRHLPNEDLSQGSSALKIILMIAGVLVSLIAVIFLIGLVGTAVRMSEATSKARASAEHLERESNLRMVGQAAQLYTSAHGRVLPPTLGDLAKHDAPYISFYVDPSVANQMPLNAAPEQLAKWVNDNAAFEFPAAGKNLANLAPDAIVAYEKNSANGGRYFLRADGYAEFMADQEANELIIKIDPAQKR